MRAFRGPVAALVIVVALNAVLPVAITMRYGAGYDPDTPPALAEYDPLTIEDVLAAADRLGGRDVFWIGDSIVWSASESGTRASRRLEQVLQSRYGSDVHVINAALPAARTGDKYAILLRVLSRRPALVIYETKYLEYSRAQVETVTFRYPYLNDVVASDPEYAEHYRDFLQAVPPLRAPLSPLQINVDRALQTWSSVARYRALLQQLAFSGDLFSRLSGAPPVPAPSPIPAGPIGLGQNTTGPSPTGTPASPGPTNEIARRPESFTGAYRSGPFDAFPNAGLFFARRVVATLDATDVPVITYVAALNHVLLGSLADDDLFHRNLSMIDGIFQGHRFAFTDEQSALADDNFFLDTEHLTSAGQTVMIQKLLSDNQREFDRALGAAR